MRLPRMTTRRWMLAAAVVGLLLGVADGSWRLKQRRDYCLQQAGKLAQVAKDLRFMASRFASRSPSQRPSIIFKGQTHEAAEVAAYCAERRKFYLRAASRPWLSVPAEPPRGTLVVILDAYTKIFADVP
jgi:hypothetical protein